MSVTLEQIEIIRERARVTYAEAKEVLEKCNGDALEALIMLEAQAKVRPPKTSAGGTIKITGELKENRAIIVVEDNGTGISQEDLPFVFNRFYKCDKSRTRQSGGTGLGLSIAKWIIEKHAGTINIESSLNKGTKVMVKLPLF